MPTSVGTPKQMRRVIDEVRRNKIPVVFSESTISDKPARQVAKETGAKYGGVLYVEFAERRARARCRPTSTSCKVTVETIAKGFGT